MKTSFFLLTLVAVAFAAPAPAAAPAAVDSAETLEKRQYCGTCVGGRRVCCGTTGICTWYDC
ncbi:hypothetical protein BDV12DRAFT_128234 [Aspergillus spectabilis]